MTGPPPATERAPKLADEAWLREQYVERKRSSTDIAAELEVDPTTVRKYLKEHGIEVRGYGKPAADHIPELSDAEWLHEQHHENDRTQQSIADELGVCRKTVAKYMDASGVERRDDLIHGAEPQVRLQRDRSLQFSPGLIHEFPFLKNAESVSVYLDEGSRRLGMRFHPDNSGKRKVHRRVQSFKISVWSPLQALDVYPSLLDEPHSVPYAVDEGAEFVAIDLSGSPAVWEVSDGE